MILLSSPFLNFRMLMIHIYPFCYVPLPAGVQYSLNVIFKKIECWMRLYHGHHCFIAEKHLWFKCCTSCSWFQISQYICFLYMMLFLPCWLSGGKFASQEMNSMYQNEIYLPLAYIHLLLCTCSQLVPTISAVSFHKEIPSIITSSAGGINFCSYISLDAK